MRFTFRFRPIPFVATIVMVTLGVLLGNWQAGRASEKLAMEQQLTMLEAAPMMQLGADLTSVNKVEYHRVQVRGEFVRDWPIYLDNRSYKGAAGFYVLMPFKIAESSTYVLVARGWTKRDNSDRTKLPELITPEGEILLEGVAVQSVGKLLKLGKEDTRIRAGDILQNITPAVFAAQTAWKLQPFYIQQRSTVVDDLVRDWPRPSLDIDRHRGYMVTWYGLALMAAIFYLVTGFGRKDEITR